MTIFEVLICKISFGDVSSPVKSSFEGSGLSAWPTGGLPDEPDRTESIDPDLELRDLVTNVSVDEPDRLLSDRAGECEPDWLALDLSSAGSDEKLDCLLFGITFGRWRFRSIVMICSCISFKWRAGSTCNSSCNRQWWRPWFAFFILFSGENWRIQVIS